MVPGRNDKTTSLSAKAGISANPSPYYKEGLRLYGPLEPFFDKTWRPGEIEVVK